MKGLLMDHILSNTLFNKSKSFVLLQRCVSTEFIPARLVAKNEQVLGGPL
jgi:hypothetical protein